MPKFVKGDHVIETEDPTTIVKLRSRGWHESTTEPAPTPAPAAAPDAPAVAPDSAEATAGQPATADDDARSASAPSRKPRR